MTREDKLYSMTGLTLIQIADNLGVKVACNKTRNQLKEAKSKVVARILEAEATQTAVDTEPEQTTIPENCEATIIDNTIVMVTSHEDISEAPISQSEDVSEEPKQNVKAKAKKTNLKLKELTYKGETKSIKVWAEELAMPWPTLYDRVNRNGWTVEDAIETPLGQRRAK